MFNYNGCVCDVCKQAFTPESDVVVCPECGTPHHRHCYKELGHCVNEARHSDGFVWNAPERIAVQNTAANICPRCHSENPRDAAFCENCGISLQHDNQKEVKVNPSSVGRENRNATFEVPPVFGKAEPGNYERVLQEEYDGVSYKDMAIYMGESAPYYIYHFRNLDKNIKHFRPFSWSACLFDGFYFLYRKMWLEALFIIFVTGILSAPSLLLMAAEMGAIDMAVVNGIAHLDMFITITSVLSLAFKVFLGYWAIPQYRKKVVKDIKRIKARSATLNDFYQTLLKKSGPVKPVLYIAVFAIALYFFM